MQRRDFLLSGGLAAAGTLLLPARAGAKVTGTRPQPVVDPASYGISEITILLTPYTSSLRANYLDASLSSAVVEPTVNWTANVAGTEAFIQVAGAKALGQFGRLYAAGSTLSFRYKEATHNVTLNLLEA